MKFSAFAILGLSAIGQAHTIAQRLRVNGADQGQLKAIRAPNNNYPIQDVNDANMACNQNRLVSTDSNVITVPAGSQVGVWWQHILGGPQGSNDQDNPIAASHKGPVIYYLAKVDNAASASSTGQKWFKVAQDGLNNGVWGVDNMISNNGWSTFTMPSCIAPGQYLLRAELIALHSAYSAGGAQFYLSCAQIQVTGSGSKTGTTMSFPGAYPSNDAGIVLNIYSAGVPNNGGKAYTPPGGAPLTC